MALFDNSIHPEDDVKLSTNGKDILHLAIDLGESFAKLDHSLRVLSDLLVQESRPFYFPPQYDFQDPRRFVANQLTDIWHSTNKDAPAKPPARSGLYCIDPAARELIELTNEAKLVFKASVFKARNEFNFGKVHKSPKGLFNVDDLLRTREPTFNAVLRRRGLVRLDLKAAYQPIEFYDKLIKSYMFFWAKSHTRVVKVKVKDVRSMLKEYMGSSESSEYAMAYNAIAHMHEEQFLAKVTPVSSKGRPVLSANIAFTDGERCMNRVANTRLYLSDHLPGHISTRAWAEGEPLTSSRTRRTKIIGDPISLHSTFHFYKE